MGGCFLHFGCADGAQRPKASNIGSLPTPGAWPGETTVRPWPYPSPRWLGCRRRCQFLPAPHISPPAETCNQPTNKWYYNKRGAGAGYGRIARGQDTAGIETWEITAVAMARSPQLRRNAPHQQYHQQESSQQQRNTRSAAASDIVPGAPVHSNVHTAHAYQSAQVSQ
jgi:hypothetical protein